MSKVSYIIPTRVETTEIEPGVSVLYKTIHGLLENSTGDFEVIVAFDGPPYIATPDDPRVFRLEMPWAGSKVAINNAALMASGKYLFKLDAHCKVSKGIDEILRENMQDNWVVIPRFYVLDAEKWQWQDERFYDYFYLPCPLTDHRGFRFKAGGHWPERTKEKISISPLDENMKLHGSGFFMSRDFYWNYIGGLTYGGSTWNGEDIEITMKTWLGPWDGRLMVNKDCWYAHMHRGGQRPREWGFSEREAQRSAMWAAKYWMLNSWDNRVHDIDWLVDRFSPVPTWPDNWKDLYKDWLSKEER